MKMKKRIKKIVLVMWILSVSLVIIGCLLSKHTAICLVLVGTGVYMALKSEDVINRYEI